MYEFHASLSAVENSRDRAFEKVIQPLIDELKTPGFLVSSGYSNGQYVAALGGCSNHDRNSEELLALFRKAGELSSTAWGIVHIFDDEADAAPVKVYGLSRGTLREIEDASDFAGFQREGAAE